MVNYGRGRLRCDLVVVIAMGRAFPLVTGGLCGLESGGEFTGTQGRGEACGLQHGR